MMCIFIIIYPYIYKLYISNNLIYNLIEQFFCLNILSTILYLPK